MKMRQRRKQFWWIYGWVTVEYILSEYTLWARGMRRVKHQHKDTMK